MQGLVPYERQRAARIAANAEKMRHLRLLQLGSALRSPSTPSGSGGAGGAGQGVPAKRRRPEGLPGPNATPEPREREFHMVLRPRKDVNYAELDVPDQRSSRLRRLDDPAGAHCRAATVDPDTELENLEWKYTSDLDARNRAIHSAVRTRSLPASSLRFLEPPRRRRRTAVRVSLATTRAPDAYKFSLAAGAVGHRPAGLDRSGSRARETRRYARG